MPFCLTVQWLKEHECMSMTARAIPKVLEVFGEAAVLCTTLSKCSVTPIVRTEDNLHKVQAFLPWPISTFPIRYLGLSLSTKIPKSHFWPLLSCSQIATVSRIPRASKSCKLILFKSVLDAVPIYALMSS